MSQLIKINQLPFMGPPDFLKFDENYSGKAPKKSSRKFVSNASLVTMPDGIQDAGEGRGRGEGRDN